MDTILHVVEIGGPADSVYRAISTAEGLAGWWSTKVAAEEEVGGVVDFTFGSDFNPDMEITEMAEPSKLTWKCVGGHDLWLGSDFKFEIRKLSDVRSQLVFTQAYGSPVDDVAFGTYNYNWAYYLHSLKQYVETGTGFPHQA